MTIVYEDDLARDFASTVRRVLEFVDEPAPADLVVRSSHRKQSDVWSELLVERYLAEERARLDATPTEMRGTSY
jgi:hypothetical protein